MEFSANQQCLGTGSMFLKTLGMIVLMIVAGGTASAEGSEAETVGGQANQQAL